MKFKKILGLIAVMPLLFVVGCRKGDDPSDEVEYSEVSQQETVSFLNQTVEDGSLDIERYSFKVKMSIPKDIFGESEEETDEEEVWPDTSDSQKWENATIEGAISLENNNLQAKFKMISDDTNADIYVRDNTIYMNSNNERYKATFDSEQNLDDFEMMEKIPNLNALLEQIDLICSSEEGLTFEKGEKDGKDYYHIYGITEINEEDDGFSFNMTMPIDLYLTFKNGKLVSYKYKTMVFIMVMEFEVETFSGNIEFPADLDSYIENKDAIL